MPQIRENISLQSLNTFGVAALARYYTEAHTLADWSALYDKGWLQKKHLVLGGGSNLLFLEDFNGLVIRQMLRGITVIQEEEDTVIIKAMAGEPWHNLVLHAVAHNWGGIENLSLIPGNAGAAPIQNIGAYGVELEQVFISLETMEIATGNISIFNKNECHFGYRQSLFKSALKGKYIILSITLQLSKNPVFHTTYGAIRDTLDRMHCKEQSVQAVSDAVIQIRKSKLPDPDILGNAGSFFKNPSISVEETHKLLDIHPSMPNFSTPEGYVKIPAGWLIEQCGWKGKRVGNTGCHAAQALVIVNYGDASGKEIWAHAKNVQASVLEKFGILLEPEVNIVSSPG